MHPGGFKITERKTVERRPVDDALVDLCKALVGGLDDNAETIPQKIVVVLGGREEALRNFVVLATRQGSSIKYLHYEGGLYPDGTFGFVHREENYEVLLTAQEIREVTTENLRQVRIEY